MTNDNNDDLFTLMIERQHAITVIECLNDYIIKYYGICPIFFFGLLQDALNSAFSSNLSKERRPVLICIHHNNNISNLFASEFFNEFLNENYIVWAWDITDESNKDILIKTLKENFSEISSINFSMNQYPILIGISRQISMENGSSSLEYESNILFISDNFEEINIELLLDQLIVFKEEFDKIEQYFSSHFVQKIVLCKDLVFEIIEYLSLNDVISTFSLAILPLLSTYNIKLPIINPSIEFIDTIIPKIQSNINSLFLNANSCKEILQFSNLNKFNNIKQLRINNLETKRQIFDIKKFFFNINYFSLNYNFNNINFRKLCKIFNFISNTTEQFEISCNSILCSHMNLRYLDIDITNPNKTIKIFILNLNEISRSIINNCVQNLSKCILNIIIDFIRIMINIEYVRIIINKGNIDTLLDKNQWKNLIIYCKNLDKIIIKIIEKKKYDLKLNEKIQEIQNDLQSIRSTIQFQVKIK